MFPESWCLGWMYHFALGFDVGRRSRYMLYAHAPWRSFRRVYVLRSCSVKVVSHGILIKCCETTFKVALTRKAYTLLTAKRKQNDLPLASAPQSVIHPKATIMYLAAFDLSFRTRNFSSSDGAFRKSSTWDMSWRTT
jgi:hypothetical protein